MTAPYSDLTATLRARLPGWEGPVSMLSLTVAGIQEFLASARTTRDVWNGSFLLSLLACDACIRMQRVSASILGCSDEDIDFAALMPKLDAQPLVRHQRKRGSVSPADLAVASFPNSILLLVPGSSSSDGDSAARIAEAGLRGMRDTWEDMVAACRKPIGAALSGFAADEWEYQTSPWRVFETYWSAIDVPDSAAAWAKAADSHGSGPPADGAPNPYADLMRWSSRALASRKALRDIEQIGEAGYRCSLCGARSALADYDSMDRSRGRDGQQWIISSARLRGFWEGLQKNEKHFRPGEHLCAVCTVRRMAPYYYLPGRGFPKVGFPSTSTLATAGGVSALISRGVADGRVADPITAFAETLRTQLATYGLADAPSLPFIEAMSHGAPPASSLCGIDGDFFYPESYSPEALAAELGLDEDEAKTVFRTSPLADLHRALRTLDPPVRFLPSNYFATIAVDGDKMGDWVSGTNAGTAFDPQWQSDLSGRLADFSAMVRLNLEDKMPGRVVYAGGDDLLAFVPREWTLQALQAIDTAWRRTVVAPGPDASGGERPRVDMTLSMACVLAKHNQPLSWVIAEAHRLLKEHAKALCGRNAFVLSRTTGGAVLASSRIRQETGTGEVDVLAAVAAVGASMTQLANETGPGLSPRIVGAAYDLDSGLAGWEETKADTSVVRRGMLERLVNRHWSDKGDTSGAQTVVAQIALLHDAMAAWVLERRNAGVELGSAWTLTANMLAMLRFLSREGR